MTIGHAAWVLVKMIIHWTKHFELHFHQVVNLQIKIELDAADHQKLIIKMNIRESFKNYLADFVR